MEGAGVRVTRTVGTPALRNLDPFLMLDELRCPAEEAAAGFPDHPHRGFETCTIMFTGSMRHKDSCGNEGLLKSGGVQLMTAGRGIIHSEMPEMEPGEPLWGFQLWQNLPAKDKMCKPQYQDIQADKIPVATADGVTVRVLAGEALGTKGVITLRNPGMMLDVQLQEGATFQQHVPSEYNAFAYVCDGAGKLSGQKVAKEHAVVFAREGDLVEASAGAEGMRFLLFAGKPIGEKIVQYGPFVMNTEAEIEQAFLDYQMGRLQNPQDNPWTAA
ncbi:unnamed protein product [Pedinophyceae sp. YPF-701]|nr:unnamed protein product [Pedinophyceae sp. YPF-701]